MMVRSILYHRSQCSISEFRIFYDFPLTAEIIDSENGDKTFWTLRGLIMCPKSDFFQFGGTMVETQIREVTGLEMP